MKSATVYFRKKQYYAFANSETTDEVWMGLPPVYSFDNLEELASQLGQVLDNTKRGIPHPTSWKGHFDFVLNKAGVKTYNTFAKGAKCVGIGLSEGNMTLLPTENAGPKEGFKHLNEKEETVAVGNTDLLTEALTRAFNHCT